MMKIGQIGFGFVGGALHRSLEKKGVKTKVYDKFQNIGSIDSLLDTDAIFFCLPTPYVEGHGFDLSAIIENLKELSLKGYPGLIVIKSTVEPGVTESLGKRFSGLHLCHNPEFLTARTADEDFHNQKHIVLGYNDLPETSEEKVEALFDFFKKHYPDTDISICRSSESESMKLFCNNFYAMKVQIFNEFFFLCQKQGIDYDVVKDLMIKNDWINPMHTLVPGPDGQASYGGACFPKDTNALKHFMKSCGSPHKVVEACIEERDSMREYKLK
jgi:UDPglucose 6-dehydrogenase